MKKYYHVFLFVLGIIATICYRLVIVLNDYGQFWVKLAWYIGTISYVWYFAHRFKVENHREKMVVEQRLEEKIISGKKLSKNDQEAIAYILKGLKISLARWNYIAIFIASLLAIGYAVWTDLIME
jgi:hypothetical protein